MQSPPASAASRCDSMEMVDVLVPLAGPNRHVARPGTGINVISPVHPRIHASDRTEHHADDVRPLPCRISLGPLSVEIKRVVQHWLILMVSWSPHYRLYYQQTRAASCGCEELCELPP